MKIAANILFACLMGSVMMQASAQSIRNYSNQNKNNVSAPGIMCEYYSPHCPAKYNAYNDGVIAIRKLQTEKLLSQAEASKRRIQLVKDSYPQDGLLLAFVSQQVGMDKILSESKLSYQQKEDLEQALANSFTYAIADRTVAIQAAIELGSERVASKAAPQTSPQVVYVEGNNAVNNAIPTAMFLNKVGQAFSTSYNQYLIPMTTCNSWGQGMVTCY